MLVLIDVSNYLNYLAQLDYPCNIRVVRLVAKLARELRRSRTCTTIRLDGPRAFGRWGSTTDEGARVLAVISTGRVELMNGKNVGAM